MNDFQTIKNQFPDVTESVFQGVIRTNPSREGAIQQLHEIFNPMADAELRQQRKNAISEDLRKIFPEVEESIITQTLNANGWNVDDAVVALFEFRENASIEQKKKERSESLLSRFYSQLSKEEIQRVLQQCNGNVDLTTARLLEITSKKEQEKRDKEESLRVQHEIDQKIAVLEKKFPDLKRNEISGHLKRLNCDLALTSKELLRISEGRKIETLQRLFQKLTTEEIQSALVATEWNFGKAVNQLTSARLAQRQAETQKQQDEERKKQLRLKQEDEASKARRQKKEKEEEEARRKKAQEKADLAFLERSQNMEKELGKILRTTEASPYDVETVKLIKEGIEAMSQGPSDSAFAFESCLSFHDRSNLEISRGFHGDLQISPVEESKQFYSFAADEEGGGGLVVEPASVDSGNELTVKWTLRDQGYTPHNDWIALYPAKEDDPTKYISYLWTNSQARDGSLIMKAPVQFGEYRLSYFKNKSYRLLAQSNVFSVGPRFEMCAEVVGEAEGRRVRVRFEQRSGSEYPNAWLGLYPSPDSENKSFVGFEWLAKAKGSRFLEFSVPKAATWYFRLFPDRSYAYVASCSVVLPGGDSLGLRFSGAETFVEYDVQTVDPKTENVWVGLYFTDEKNYRQYRRCQYIYEIGKGQIVFKTPIHQGTYHARLFAGNSSVPLLCSNPISVPNSL